MTQTVYQIGPAGLLAGSREIADSDPMRPGETLDAPPDVGAGEVAVYTPSGWVAVTGPPPAPPFIAPTGPAVPESVELWRARAVCAVTPSPSGTGTLEDAIEAAIGGLAGETQATVGAFWNYGQSISRQSPTLLQLAGVIGVSSDGLDQLFIAGAALTQP